MKDPSSEKLFGPGRLDVDYLATLSLCQILDSHGMRLGNIYIYIYIYQEIHENRCQ